MMDEKYQREAELIARRFYRKDWHKISGNLRREIYQMAVDTVNHRERVRQRREAPAARHLDSSR